MKSSSARLVLALTITLLVSCSRRLPEAYGVYAETNRGRLVLNAQMVHVKGNIMSSISGLSGPSGSECDALKEFIVYEKDIHPNEVFVDRLKFVQDGQISEIFASTRIKVNLWTPTQRFNLDVKPVDNRPDMYILVPRSPLPIGFYALHIGPLGQGPAYDLVVGSSKNFPSYAQASANQSEQFRNISAELLGRMNELLNRREYSLLQEVYRPDGKTLSGSELQDFIVKSQTWLDSAGPIVNSEIVGVEPFDDGKAARCSVSTKYTKAGRQQESVTVAKIGNRYFITALQ